MKLRKRRLTLVILLIVGLILAYRLKCFYLERSTSATLHSLGDSEEVSLVPPSPLAKPITCSEVHIFYYPWYGNPNHDGKWLHWDHPVIKHWNDAVSARFNNPSRPIPPEDVGSNFYPLLGPYSSRDPIVLDRHMSFINASGTGVVVVSFYPENMADDQGQPWQDVYEKVMDSAFRYGLKVTFQIEPYATRSALSVRNDLAWILDRCRQHPAFYLRRHKDGRLLALLYIYDSYLTPADEWAKVFQIDTRNTIRRTQIDAIVVGLLAHQHHLDHIENSGFDGLYTYFASDGFTFGSTQDRWGFLRSWTSSRGLLFIPSVGPGYIDTMVRPWNGENTKDRLSGRYYERSWDRALSSSPDAISVTSFNEWHEGTQIEPVMNAYRSASRSYLDYLPLPQDGYIELTRRFASNFTGCPYLSIRD